MFLLNIFGFHLIWEFLSSLSTVNNACTVNSSNTDYDEFIHARVNPTFDKMYQFPLFEVGVSLKNIWLQHDVNFKILNVIVEAE